MNDMTQQDFEYYQALLMQHSGLALTAEKSYLLKTRLTPVASSLGYANLQDMTLDMRNKTDVVMTKKIVEAMTTNETSFFRDAKPFQNLIDMLPRLMEKNAISKTIRIWSAACSTGQEAYSIAMTLEEYFADKPGWRYEIVGTDISENALSRARKGEFNQFEIQRGLTIQKMVQYFVQEGSNWRIKEHLQKHVTFQYANLLENMSMIRKFDVVFCRNVLIYFNKETKAQVLNNIGCHMANEGILFLGACETIVNLDVPYNPLKNYNGLFEKRSEMVPINKMQNSQSILNAS